MTENKEKQNTGETFTFTDKPGEFVLTIKSEFLKKVPNPQDFKFVELLSQHEMTPFLHNPHGPAVIVPRNGHEDYWLDGKMCTPEVRERIKHNIKFNNELESILDK